MPKPRLRIVEPVAFDHGPLWLDYMLRAFSHDWQISVKCPDNEHYRNWSTAAKNLLPDLEVDFFVYDRKLPWQAILSSDGQDPFDHTLITMLDRWLFKIKPKDDPRLVAKSEISAIWFLPPFKQSRWQSALNLVRSPSLLYHNRGQQFLRKCPHWVSKLCVLDVQSAHDINTNKGQSVHVIPDPWPSWTDIGQCDARRKLRLPLDEKIFLMMGSDGARKGLLDCIRAWNYIPNDVPAVFVKAGRVKPKRLAKCDSLIAQGRMILRNEWISDSDMNLYLAAADWVLLPYRYHHGSSGLLAGAAAAGKPVIASDYGIVGRRVREQKLGRVYRHLSPRALAQSIEASVSDNSLDRFRDPLRRYNEEHSATTLIEKLRTIFS